MHVKIENMFKHWFGNNLNCRHLTSVLTRHIIRHNVFETMMTEFEKRAYNTAITSRFKPYVYVL